MSYYILKNLKLNKKDNKITAEVADSSITNYNNNYIFYKTEDFYSSEQTWKEKYAHLIYDVIVGNVHINGNNLLKRIEFKNGIKELENYYEDVKKYGILETYDKYENVINGILEEKKEYIIKFENSNAYLKSIGLTKYKYTFDIEQAKKYTKREAERVLGIEKHKIVNYNEELYKSKEEKYVLFLNVINKTEMSYIEEKDSEIFIDLYKMTGTIEEKYKLYSNMLEKYKNNALLSEIVRVLSIKCDGINERKNCYDFDYDYDKQFKILENEIYKNYIDKSLENINIETYNEIQNDEEELG